MSKMEEAAAVAAAGSAAGHTHKKGPMQPPSHVGNTHACVCAVRKDMQQAAARGSCRFTSSAEHLIIIISLDDEGGPGRAGSEHKDAAGTQRKGSHFIHLHRWLISQIPARLFVRLCPNAQLLLLSLHSSHACCFSFSLCLASASCCSPKGQRHRTA